MKTLSALLLLIAGAACAQTGAPTKLDFALLEHPGHLSLDRGNWKLTELSAKANGGEFGIKAEDGDLHLLAFLFLWPEEAPLTAESCRDKMLKAEGIPADASADRTSFRSASGVDIATVLLIPKDAHFSQIPPSGASSSASAGSSASSPRLFG